MNKCQQLRSMIDGDKAIVAPGVFDGLSARLVEVAGFQLVYASGGAIARSTGVPDIGLLSLTEVRDRLAQITAVTNIPVLADADTGFGNEVNVQRTIQLFEAAGVAGIHIEDQQFPKRCGHLNDKTLVSPDDMVKKVKVAKQSASDKDFVIVARTDAIAVEGFEPAIERAQQYLAAGADMIFVEAPQTVEQIEAIARAIPQPKLMNMFYGGKTPLVPKKDLQAMGYRIVIIPSDLQRAAIRAMENILAEIYKSGDSKALAEQIVTFKEREAIVRTQEYLALGE